VATPTVQTITISPATAIHPIGEVVQVATLFATDGAAVDPAVVRFDYTSVAVGTVTALIYGTDAALVKDSTGNYHVNIDTTPSGGIWKWRFYATGTSQSSTEGNFYVRPNAAVAGTPTALFTGTQITGEALTAISVTQNLAYALVVGSERLFRNGARLKNPSSYTISGQVITLALPLVAGEELLADYIRS
jgi:hypothetical protein